MAKKIKLVKKGNFLYSKFVKCLLTVAVIYMFVLFCKQQITISRLSVEQSNSYSQIKEQQNINKDLKNQMSDSKKLQRIEKKAREELGYLKNNERLFIDASSK